MASSLIITLSLRVSASRTVKVTSFKFMRNLKGVIGSCKVHNSLDKKNSHRITVDSLGIYARHLQFQLLKHSTMTINAKQGIKA